MKYYELSVIGNPDTHEETMRKVEEVLNKHTEIVKVEGDGVKHLAYPIDGYDKGDYIYYDIVIKDKNAPAKISSALNLTDEVLRYLLVNVDGKNKAKWAEEYENKMAEATEQ